MKALIIFSKHPLGALKTAFKVTYTQLFKSLLVGRCVVLFGPPMTFLDILIREGSFCCFSYQPPQLVSSLAESPVWTPLIK